MFCFVRFYLLCFWVVLSNLFRRQIHTVSVKNLELLLIILYINIDKVSIGAFHLIKEAVALKSAILFSLTIIYRSVARSRPTH